MRSRWVHPAINYAAKGSYAHDVSAVNKLIVSFSARKAATGRNMAITVPDVITVAAAMPLGEAC
jgi:hypothetical protein